MIVLILTNNGWMLAEQLTIFKEDEAMTLSEFSARSISAAVIKLAVEDLIRAHEKIKRLKGLKDKNELRQFLKRYKNQPDKYRLSHDEESAITFFKGNENRSLYTLYASILDFDTPDKINDMLSYLEKHKTNILKVVTMELKELEK